MSVPRALTIAGSDSGGGAGLQQDLKTFQALGVWGMSAVTAITVQNTLGVQRFDAVDPQTIFDQIVAVASDIGVDAAKTGMLPTPACAEAVADAVGTCAIQRLVIDPVQVASRGSSLAAAGTLETIMKVLMPLAELITPNSEEASAMCGFTVASHEQQIDAAKAIHQMGGAAVLVTGGHIEGDAVDVFFDGDDLVELQAPRIGNRSTHGTGCMLSAAITATLAKGQDLLAAVQEGKNVVTAGIRGGLDLGRGTGPVDPGGLVL